MTNECAFIPVNGSEESIKNHPITPGYFYIATDSGRMFLDVDSELRLPIGGAGSVIYYAQDSNVTDSGFGYYVLNKSAIEDENNGLKVSDLIINIADKCFYRVDLVDEETVNATKIAVAGSGGGEGGGGSGDGPSSFGYTSVSRVTKRDVYVLYGSDCDVEFEVIAQNSAGEDTDGGTVNWTLNKVPIANQTVRCGKNSFNIKDHISNNTSAQVLTGTFYLDNGTDTPRVHTMSWNIYAVEVTLDWKYNLSTIHAGDNVSLTWSVIGNNNIQKTLKILIDNRIEFTQDLGTAVGQRATELNKNLYGLTHGIHTLTMWIDFKIDEVNGGSSNKITNEIICVDEDNKNPIIITDVSKYDTEVSQYDMISIPVYIYNATYASIQIDGVEKEQWDTSAAVNGLYTGTIYHTPVEAGESILRIVCNSNIAYTIVFDVKDIGISVTEVKDYAFKIKASDFMTNESLKQSELLSFSDNFDWVNGGLKREKDEFGSDRSFICVKSGTTMTLNYHLFEKFDKTKGKEIKTIFKVVNCGNYDAEAITCLGYINPDAEADARREVGLKLCAQEGYLYSQTNTVNMKYCEDTYIECELDIAPSSGTMQYIMPWLNGVPAGITVYGTDEFIQNKTEVANITVGSPDCDVYLYLFKVYERHLSNEEHLNNFIMDATNTQEISKRYKRNDILDDKGNGEISWEKVLKNNPKCWIHLYDIPRMTKNKKDEIGWNKTTGTFSDEVAQYYALYKDGNTTPVVQAGAKINLPFTYKVQGTSSEKYVISAANLDTNFRSGVLTEDGTVSKKFKLADNLPAEKYYNTKVNVASCEGANNALNAVWYNDHQPYICAARKKNPDKRDTMLFTPGIVFMIDRNPKYEKQTGETNLDLNIFKGDPVYENASEKFYKQYAICNFGNSKKNIETLHDTSNEHEVCIEVTDNQNFGQRMTKVVGRSEEMVNVLDENGDPVLDDSGKPVQEKKQVDLTFAEIEYDFETETGNDTYNLFKASMDDQDYDVRYANGADGVDSLSPQHIIGFFKLVQWFAQNDPCEYNPDTHPYGWTGEALPEAVTFAPKVFNKKDWKGDDTVLGNIANFSDSTYAGEYTYDTHEYRMAKLLNECEEHLIMDSIVYHYLFIERHLMVDNVAKNTFWTSEDENNQYWCLVKDYDNDTADGIDNDGKLAFTYGIEPGDTYNGNLSYFNAETSVWFNFLQGLSKTNTEMFKALEGSGVWSAKLYLDKFTEWQGSIPERCWIEDYYRKYIRPFEVFNDNGYLARLEGGKKDLQRKQFETYQEIYMNTKYESKAVLDSYIDIRANSSDTSNLKIPVTMYSDCYIYQIWAQNVIKKRAKRGVEYLIECPKSISTMSNATVYWYAPSTYAKIGNIGVLNPQSVKMSESSRLQELEVSGTLENPLESLNDTQAPSIGQATLIKNLKFNYLSNLNDGAGVELNLSEQTSLHDFEAIGSKFTGIKFPEGAPIVSIHANSPAAITMKDLRYIEDFELEDYTKLQAVYIQNIDESRINSYTDIVKKIGNNLTFYSLRDVKWVITDASDLNSSNNTINILELLKSKTARTHEGFDDTTGDNGLTGSLLIAESAYAGNNSLEICEKYEKIFPKLDINFEAENCRLYQITVINGNGQPAWTKKFKQSTTLSTGLFDSLGTIVEDVIEKSNTDESVFTFANKWKVTYQDSEESFEVNGDSNKLPVDGSKTVSGDIVIEPIYTSTPRKWTIAYYSNDGLTKFFEKEIEYGTVISEAISLSDIAPYQDDSALALEETYVFKGWTTTVNGKNVFANYDIMQVRTNQNFYAVFAIGNVHLNTTPLEYFHIEENTSWNLSSLVYGRYVSPYEGLVLSPAATDILKGKITIPKEVNGRPVVAIAGFHLNGHPQKDLTHVFFEPNSQVKIFCNQVFNECSKKLKYIEIPTSLESICVMACANLPQLMIPDLSKCNNLLFIDNNVFYRVSNQGGVLENFQIPGSVIVLGFQLLLQDIGNEYSITTLQLGSNEHPSQLQTFINSNVFTIGSSNEASSMVVKNLIIYAGNNDFAKSFETQVAKKETITVL